MSERHITDRVDLRTAEGVLDCYTFQPGSAGGSAAGPWPGVILYMDAFGIRPQLASMAQRLADGGYFVVVPNLYYRSGPFAPFDPKEVFSEGAEQQRFKGMIGSITHDMIMADTAAVIGLLDAQSLVKPGSIGAVGYCMGGGYALSAAGTFPDLVAVAASFHGVSLATDKPDSPHRLAPRIRARVYIGVAGIDPGFPPEQRMRLEEALREAGVDHRVEIYEGAKHGFAVTGHLVYDEVASERHWHVLLELLRESLHAPVI
jgi:carboxymethylenebutenolidase